MLVHDRTQAGVDVHQIGSIESSSLRPEPANAPPNTPHASLTAHAPRISHAVVCRGYRVHGKAYVTSSAVRDQASFLAIRDHSVYPIMHTTPRCIADGRLRARRTQASCPCRSRHDTAPLQKWPTTCLSRVTSCMTLTRDTTLASHQTSRSRCDMSVGTCHQSRARHAGWVFSSDRLSTSVPCIKHTCTSSHAPAPHARSPLRTHDEHLSTENLLAVSLLTIIPRTSAGPSNAIFEDQLAYMATSP